MKIIMLIMGIMGFALNILIASGEPFVIEKSKKINLAVYIEDDTLFIDWEKTVIETKTKVVSKKKTKKKKPCKMWVYPCPEAYDPYLNPPSERFGFWKIYITPVKHEYRFPGSKKKNKLVIKGPKSSKIEFVNPRNFPYKWDVEKLSEGRDMTINWEISNIEVDILNVQQAPSPIRKKGCYVPCDKN